MAQTIPENYQRLEGSERRLGRKSNRAGMPDADEITAITVVVRRRPDGPAMPDYDYWSRTPLKERRYLSLDELTQRHGATPEDIEAVEAFVRSHGMRVLEVSAARRTVAAAGTVAQMNAAFGIELRRYHSPLPHRRSERTSRKASPAPRQVHRGYEGHVHIPKSLAKIVVGVLGLDDRKITSRNGVPPQTGVVTAPQVCQLYGWPTGSISGQTIGLLSASSGFDPNDIKLYYENLNKSLFAAGFYVQGSTPTSQGTATAPSAGAVAGKLVAPSPVIGSLTTSTTFATNGGTSDGEINMDICLSSSIAQGAEIAVYLFDGSANGWLTILGQAISPAPQPGQAAPPQPTVISSSYFFAFGDDAAALADWGLSANDIANISDVLHDATTIGITICIASGDSGTDSDVEDGSAHVQYPGSDPSVLACGGTSIGNISGSNFSEYIWNDLGTTGGGVSAFFNSGNSNSAFRQPCYQNGAEIPVSLNDSSVGRGMPDVAANASPISGYVIYTNGVAELGVGGTSASAPLIAGFIAQVNAKLGKNAGFLNPLIYSTHGTMCRKVTGGSPLNGDAQNPPPRPVDNACHGVTGYPGTQTGWDACTGWGVFDWNAVLKALSGQS